MFEYLKKKFSVAKSSQAPSADEFSARFHRFKLFLGAYLDAYGELMAFEERLSGTLPFGMPFLRSCTAKLTASTMHCVMQLNALSGGRYTKIDENFSLLRKEVQSLLLPPSDPPEGAFVLSVEELTSEHSALASSYLINLAALIRKFPQQAPKGFVITAAAWWLYMSDQQLHDEIDRSMVISQDEPGSFGEASERITKYITDFPLPEEMRASVSRALDPLRPLLAEPGHVILIRTLPVKEEHGALVIPQLSLSTPCSDEDIFTSLKLSFARMYQPRAIIYRMKLGLRDRSMPFCWSFSILPERHTRGSSHLDFENPSAVAIHIRRGIVGEVSPSLNSSTMIISEQMHEKISHSCKNMLDYLRELNGENHEIFWAADSEGDCIMLGASYMPSPNPESMALATTVSHHMQDYPELYHKIEGGLATFPGLLLGPAYIVRNLDDALFFPIGSLLLVDQAVPRWSFLFDFARGAISGDGSGNGLFARTARRYGKPAILSLPEAVSAFSSDEQICMAASLTSPAVMAVADTGTSVVEPKSVAEETPRGYLEAYRKAEGLQWMPHSDIGAIAAKLVPLVLTVSQDEEEGEVTGQNCTSFHDYLLFFYSRAVRDMYRFSTSVKSAEAPAKQLVCEVPKQFWIIDMNDGFTEHVKGPVVQLEQIASIPMRAFWQGFMSKPWDGPPQIDAKGLLSVFFEATVNPSLDPAVQSSKYVEKNTFLIAKRFCSMRCRFGFHFLALDCLVGERAKERFIIFQFKGGAANLGRRIRRVKFVAELLAHFNFTTDIVSDTLTARMEQGEEADFIAALKVIGYVVMHTRQLDMIMGDEEALATYHAQMMKDMTELAAPSE